MVGMKPLGGITDGLGGIVADKQCDESAHRVFSWGTQRES